MRVCRLVVVLHGYAVRERDGRREMTSDTRHRKRRLSQSEQLYGRINRSPGADMNFQTTLQIRGIRKPKTVVTTFNALKCKRVLRCAGWNS